jgi:hypothetical protein
MVAQELRALQVKAELRVHQELREMMELVVQVERKELVVLVV